MRMFYLVFIFEMGSKIWEEKYNDKFELKATIQIKIL